MKIAVDFDGTIVEHRYPAIGKPILFAFETLKKLEEQRHQLILWTYRSGKELDQAVAFCRKNGIEFYAVNKNYPRNIGGLPGWGEIWQMIHPELNPVYSDEVRSLPRRQGLLRRIFGK